MTAIVTVSVDLIVAVVIGMVVAASSRSVGWPARQGAARADRSAPREPGDERIAVIRLDGPLFFAAADRVLEEVTSLRRRDRW